MAKYHVNPTTSNPSVCRATKDGGCPFNLSADWHKENIAEVFEILEKVNADFLIPKTLKRRGEPNPVRLQSILQWVNPSIYTPRTVNNRGLSLNRAVL